jgi:hypothetical protein
MRQNALRRPNKTVSRRAVASIITFRSPSRGWNARDAITDLKADEAIVLDNWLPGTGELEVRPGCIDHATGMGGRVESLMPWTGGASAKMFAVDDDGGAVSIYDVTGNGIVGAAVVSGLTSARFDHVMFANGAGEWLVAVNGQNDRQLFDGSAFTTSPAITGVSSADLDRVTAHKGRLWFAERNLLRSWYLAPLAVGGAATSFSLHGLARKGGRIAQIIPWSRDGGAGPDDELVFLTSQGEAIIFAGTDPSSSATWGLRGIYSLPRPIGMRPMIAHGADLLIQTVEGVFSLSNVVAASTSGRQRVAITDRIHRAALQAAKTYGTLFGWQIIEYGAEGWLIVNVPTLGGAKAQQFVRVGTGAWCRFTDWNAVSWANYNDGAFFGTADGRVVQAAVGLSDFGLAINARLLPSFQGISGDRSTHKSFKDARPLFISDANIAPQIGFLVDYQDRNPQAATTETEAGGATWDVAPWDTELWGGAMTATSELFDIYAEGRVVSPATAVLIKDARLRLAHIDIIAERGGAL